MDGSIQGLLRKQNFIKPSVLPNSTTYKLLFLLLALVLCTKLRSQQLCEGNLGINIFEDGDFGSGADNVITTDPQIAPGYTYSNVSQAPSDGFYTITNSTRDWSFNFQTWLDIGDNSDDPEGYMMVVNASFEPGLFYEEEVTGLCENTFYEFSADIINIIRTPVSDHILPNIEFLIDDVPRFSSGNIPQNGRWNKYGFTFTTEPGQTSVKLSLKNNAPGGFGNDLALDNISFQACGPDAFVNAEQTIFICEQDNQPVTIEADISATDQVIQWQFSSDSITWVDIPNATSETIVHDQFDVGLYYYRYISAGTEVELLNDKCSIISDVLPVEVVPLEYLVFDTICFNETLAFGTQTLAASGSYFEAFISSIGCDSMVDLELTVLPEEILNIDTLAIDPLCFGDDNGSIELLLSGQFPPYLFAINEATTDNSLFEGLMAGNYQITVTDKFGCLSFIDVTLDNPPVLTLQVSPTDTKIALGDRLDVDLSSNYDPISIDWSPDSISPCGDCLSFDFLPTASQTYTATATNTNGCTASTELNINIDIDDLDIYIPNIFDPSLVGVDNGLTIGAKEGLISEIVNFYVYDRWGNLVHHVSNSTELKLWDGRINNQKVDPAVFVYVLEVKLIDDMVYLFSGDLMVLK